MLENENNTMNFVIGAGNIFQFTIRFNEPSEIHCYLSDGTVSRELTSVEFSVEAKTSYENGADITLLITPIPTGKTLIVERKVPYKQMTSLPNAGKLPSETLEVQLDKLVMMMQQMKDALSRSVVFPPGSAQTVEALIQSMQDRLELAMTAADSAADAQAATLILKDAAQSIKDDVQTLSDNIAAAIANKAENTFSNAVATLDFITDFWMAEDGLTWYAKYRSGRVDQGGYVVAPTSGSLSSTVTFPVPFETMPASLTAQELGTNTDALYDMSRISNVTNNAFIYAHHAAAGNPDLGFFWHASGKKATT